MIIFQGNMIANSFKDPEAERSEVLLDVQVNERVVFDPEVEGLIMFIEGLG